MFNDKYFSFRELTMFPFVYQLSQNGLQYRKWQELLELYDHWPHIKPFNPYHFISICLWTSLSPSFFSNLTWKQILFALQRILILYLQFCLSVHREKQVVKYLVQNLRERIAVKCFLVLSKLRANFFAHSTSVNASSILHQSSCYVNYITPAC